MPTTLKKLNTLTKQVEHILASVPDSRNNDLELQAALLVTFYPKMEHPISNWLEFTSVMRSVPTLDHIARARRKVIQNHGGLKYLPTDPLVAKARGVSMEIWREYAKQENKDYAKNNYPPEIEHTLAMTGKTGFDD